MRLALLLASVAAASLCSAAYADDIFVLTGSGHTFSFELPVSPTPTATDADGFVLNSVAVDIDGTISNHAVGFYHAGVGGLSIANQNAGFSTAGLLVNASGPAVYSGPDGMPTFNLGTYELVNRGIGNPMYTGPFTLTIQTAPTSVTPEPSTLALLGTGLVSAVGALRKRFR